MCRNCRRGEPCASCLAENRPDHSTLFCGGVMTCVPNAGNQELVGAFARAVLAHLGVLR